MRKKIFNTISFLLILAVVACATTELTHVWKDGKFQAIPVKKVVVVGIAKEPAKRQLFEDEFAQRLLAHGVSVIKSYTIMTLEELKDKQGAAAKLRELGADAVLATRLIDKKTVETYYPPTYSYAPAGGYYGWGGYYGMGYSYMASPGYTVSEEVAKLETNIYDTKSEGLIWSALSDTWLDRAAPDKLVSSFIGVIVDRMTKDGIIPPLGGKKSS
jgi:hypothetical protein